MPTDRNGERLFVGQSVMLTTGMAVAGVRKAKVSRIDGADIYLNIWVDGHYHRGIHRYGNEMEAF